ncbi:MULTISPECIES: hypothetical protein [Fischerella]
MNEIHFIRANLSKLNLSDSVLSKTF